MIGYKGGGGVYAESGEPALASHAEPESLPEVEVVGAAEADTSFAGHCCLPLPPLLLEAPV